MLLGSKVLDKIVYGLAMPATIMFGKNAKILHAMNSPINTEGTWSFFQMRRMGHW